MYRSEEEFKTERVQRKNVLQSIYSCVDLRDGWEIKKTHRQGGQSSLDWTLKKLK